MDAQDYIRVIRKRWATIAAMTLAMVLLAALASYFTPKSYRATSEMFVSTTAGDTNADLASGTTFMSKQIKTYADIMTSPKVLDPVRKQMGVEPGTPLADSITATVPPETVLIDVAVTDRDPAKAAKVANLISEQFTKTVGELQSVAEGKVSPVKVTVVRPAALPTVPVAPQPVRNIALGLAVGLLLGLGLALLRDVLDTSVKGESDVQAVTDKTIIGGIQFDPGATRQPLIVQGDPHSTRAEAFRSLRTNLQFVDVANRPRTMVFTSSLPGEGKTTTTANLALTMGDSGVNVCIVEGDLRRPKLLEYMGLESGVGLTSVLIGEAELDDVLQPFGERVTALGAGPIPPNPSELLGSPAMAELLEQLKERFDYVIIDAPPLLPVTDAAVVSSLVDGVVVVVGRGVIKRENLARALGVLDTVGAHVLGIVMNRMPTKGIDSYSYYGERYSYRPEVESKAKKRKGSDVPVVSTPVDVAPVAPRSEMDVAPVAEQPVDAEVAPSAAIIAADTVASSSGRRKHRTPRDRAPRERAPRTDRSEERLGLGNLFGDGDDRDERDDYAGRQQLRDRDLVDDQTHVNGYRDEPVHEQFADDQSDLHPETSGATRADDPALRA